MLILNDTHCLRAGVASLDQQCMYCCKALKEYPLIMSDAAEQTVYHAACAAELATDILVDLYTFFRPPTPYNRLFVITALGSQEHFQPFMQRSDPCQTEAKTGEKDARSPQGRGATRSA